VYMSDNNEVNVGPGATIVSAFMANINYRADRSYDTYLILAKQLLRVEINKVIFIDRSVLHHFTKFANENTTIIPFVKEANYLYEYKDKLPDFELNTKNPGKDSLEYMFTMCYKTEFVRKAIQLNNYNASQFIWLDLGIKHTMNNISEEEFAKKILRLQYLEYPLHVRIGAIWNPDRHYRLDLYKDICWCFAGGIFGGNIKSLIQFADLTKETILNTMNEKKTIMWEINIWKLIYNMDRWKFLFYTCGHDNLMIDNY
jgi:hypothetical protein